MKGTWQPSDDSGNAGTYVDTRGVSWSVSSKPVGSGLIQQRQYMAQSQGDEDAQRYFTRTGWTVRTRDAVFDDVDTWVTGAASPSPNMGGLIALALMAYLLLDERRK